MWHFAFHHAWICRNYHNNILISCCNICIEHHILDEFGCADFDIYHHNDILNTNWNNYKPCQHGYVYHSQRSIFNLSYFILGVNIDWGETNDDRTVDGVVKLPGLQLLLCCNCLGGLGILSESFSPLRLLPNFCCKFICDCMAKYSRKSSAE